MTSSIVTGSKPMSISSIMAAPIFPPSPPNSSFHQAKPYLSQQHHHHHQRQPSTLRSPPISPEENMFESSAPSSPQSMASSSSSVSNGQGGTAPPLTLQERRLRNKTASAKYRQKKNQQQNEMRQMISCLSEQNAVLERQLQELRMENERLKATTDRLRGKMVAKKMLKQYFGRHHKDSSSLRTSTKNTSATATPKQPREFRPYGQFSPSYSSDDEDLELGLDVEQDELESLSDSA